MSSSFDSRAGFSDGLPLIPLRPPTAHVPPGTAADLTTETTAAEADAENPAAASGTSRTENAKIRSFVITWAPLIIGSFSVLASAGIVGLVTKNCEGKNGAASATVTVTETDTVYLAATETPTLRLLARTDAGWGDEEVSLQGQIAILCADGNTTVYELVSELHTKDATRTMHSDPGPSRTSVLNLFVTPTATGPDPPADPFTILIQLPEASTAEEKVRSSTEDA